MAKFRIGDRVKIEAVVCGPGEYLSGALYLDHDGKVFTVPAAVAEVVGRVWHVGDVALVGFRYGKVVAIVDGYAWVKLAGDLFETVRVEDLELSP